MKDCIAVLRWGGVAPARRTCPVDSLASLRLLKCSITRHYKCRFSLHLARSLMDACLDARFQVFHVKFSIHCKACRTAGLVAWWLQLCFAETANIQILQEIKQQAPMVPYLCLIRVMNMHDNEWSQFMSLNSEIISKGNNWPRTCMSQSKWKQKFKVQFQN